MVCLQGPRKVSDVEHICSTKRWGTFFKEAGRLVVRHRTELRTSPTGRRKLEKQDVSYGRE